MKNLIAVALVGVFAVGMVQAHQTNQPHEHNAALGTAHAAEKKLPPVEVKADAPATKKACVKQLDPKTKKEKEVCKTIKVHKKLEVTDQKK
jgi:hypothetical protein